MASKEKKKKTKKNKDGDSSANNSKKEKKLTREEKKNLKEEKKKEKEKLKQKKREEKLNRKKEKKERRKRNFKDRLIRIKALFLGRTKKQQSRDNPSYIGKKYVIMFLLFIMANLFLFFEMNLEETNEFIVFFNIISINNPYNYGLALTFTFLEFSLLFTNDRILKWFFEDKMVLKQVGIFIGLVYINFGIVTLFRLSGSLLYSTLLFLAIFWLILQSFRIFFFFFFFGNGL